MGRRSRAAERERRAADAAGAWPLGAGGRALKGRAVGGVALIAAAGLLTAADRPPVCENATWVADGRFHSLWHDTGTACIRAVGRDGYAVTWRLGAGGNMVAGIGWARGRPDRIVRYRAAAFSPGANGYLALYGWSRDPLVEYYVVENWGGFTPPGPDAVRLGTVASDGGTYRIYRTRRIDQPSIAGRTSFDQYWSVRTMRRPVGEPATITFARHVAAWRGLGLRLGRPDYQIVATEGFGSDGHARVGVAR